MHVCTANSPEAISYATAVSAIIACPYKLRSGEEARALFKARFSWPRPRESSQY